MIIISVSLWGCGCTDPGGRKTLRWRRTVTPQVTPLWELWSSLCWGNIGGFTATLLNPKEWIGPPVTFQELSEAVAQMASGRSPGVDGLPADLYKSSWSVLGPDWYDLVMECLRMGELPLSCHRAVLTLPPKKGELSDLRNWQPVAWLCADIKIEESGKLANFWNWATWDRRTGWTWRHCSSCQRCQGLNVYVRCLCIVLQWRHRRVLIKVVKVSLALSSLSHSLSLSGKSPVRISWFMWSRSCQVLCSSSLLLWHHSQILLHLQLWHFVLPVNVVEFLGLRVCGSLGLHMWCWWRWSGRKCRKSPPDSLCLHLTLWAAGSVCVCCSLRPEVLQSAV